MTHGTPPLDPPGTIRFVVLSGSHAYGIATETSDEDWRGVYQAPTDEFLGLVPPIKTWERDDHVTLWELGHFCRLLLGGNPNIVGTLSSPDDVVYDVCPVIDLLRSNRRAFVSHQMVNAYLGWVWNELRWADRNEVSGKRLSHVPRLLAELDSARAGDLVIRPTGPTRSMIVDVKEGRQGLDHVHRYVDFIMPGLEEWGDTLPDAPRDWVEDILVRARHGEFG